MNLLDAVYEQLQKVGKPQTVHQLLNPILKSGAWSTKGKTPEATIGARIYCDIKKYGAQSRFVKVGKGLFALSGVSGCHCGKLSQGDLFDSEESKKTTLTLPTSGTVGMNSMFYEPALAILKDAHGKMLSANEVKKQILAQYPDLKWGGTQGPIRAMLLAASKRSTPIKQVMGSRPPLFYYDGTNKGNADVPKATPEEIIEGAIAQCEADLKKALLKKVQEMDDTVFEELVNQLIERLGFGTHYTTPPSHDGGIDGMIFGDSLGLNVVCVQAKHYTSNNVERGEIDKFIGALEGRNGVFVTTSGFTSGAKNKAEHTGSNSHIALIDGARLCDLMLKCNLGVQETDKRFVIKRIDNDFFEELEG